ncbi:unnamed protein product [Caenorhabditis angaria]|uniref:Uncharacterized protein n=1 Tax=Caenorhabditis angaria TaxID=860376 RepID=A0A9P1I7T6_9PELO|nr:unnamed protein product [Caenorhabditis angaria]
MVSRSIPIFFLISIFSIVLAENQLKIEKEINSAIDQKQIKASPYYKDQMLKVPISREAGKELLQHWTDQAFSGLISAIATRRIKGANTYNQNRHETCASESHDLVHHAKCLVELENALKSQHNLKRRKMLRSKKTTRKSKKWVGSFKTRAKRSIKNVANYQLKSENDRSPFGIITKHLTNTVKIFKNKKNLGRWQDTISRIQEKAENLKARDKAEKIAKKRFDVFRNGVKKLRMKDEPKIINERRFADPMLKKYEKIEKLIEDEDLREAFHAKTQNMTDEEKIMMAPVEIIREVAKLGLAMGGKNTSDFDRKNVRMISPKFMSILPEDEEQKGNAIDIFSPSLFSLHDSGSGSEKDASLKSILGKTTLDSQDTQNLIDFLVEATGVSEAVEEAESKIQKATRLKDEAMGRGPDGQPLYFTKKNITEKFPKEAPKIELFEKLDKTYTVEQLKEMNQTGYTILSPEQMNLVYGKKSPFRNAKLMKTYKNMTRDEIQRAIHHQIDDVAKEKLKFEVRQKDIVLSPIVNTVLLNAPEIASQPIILSPVLMVPLIQSPAVFGAVILSPWLFVPVILSPRLLSPVILDPFMFVPIILSPLALDPVILSPGIFNPFVLSPLVLSPFILSPQVMTPLILSPFALTPLILNPLLLSPLVLSPFVLSPQILSPQFVTAIILSPYALSPAIKSDGAMVTVFASPSCFPTHHPLSRPHGPSHPITRGVWCSHPITLAIRPSYRVSPCPQSYRPGSLHVRPNHPITTRIGPCYPITRRVQPYHPVTIGSFTVHFIATSYDTLDLVTVRPHTFNTKPSVIIPSGAITIRPITSDIIASQPIILSPVLMVPLIQSPSIFGPVVLSPWLFVPVILSPRIMSPIILDPFMFVPIILSPLALHPVILSPGVFNPLVLSPLVLSPFILSPQVMTPLILSPFALTPLILTPLLLSPLVLSPFVLSPQILSPQLVTGIILSPYALSPAIKSDGAMVTVFASPSWLS